MPREYTHVKLIESQIIEMRKKGKCRREIAESFGLSIIQVKSCIARFNKRQKQMEKGISPQPKGRPRKQPISIQEKLELENKRLHMENELLRDFLCETERGCVRRSNTE